jgi:hypothetical protein
VQPKIEVAFGEKTFQFAPVHNVSGALNGTYTLFDFGRLASNIQKAKLELQTSKHVAEQLKHSLFFQVSQLYYQIIYAKKAIEIQNQVLLLLTENKTIIETKGYEKQESVDRKTALAESFGYTVKVLRKDDLQYAFEYVKTTYQTSKYYTLYDEYKPKYNYVCSCCNKSFTRLDNLKKHEKNTQFESATEKEEEQQTAQ